MEISTPGSASWQTLLDRAVALLDAVGVAVGSPLPWTVGGGTVLMLHYRHRTSRDIDIFLRDAQLLTLLTPRLNQDAASIARDYVEASNFVKLTCAEGEIDFIVAPDLSDLPHEEATFRGKPVTLERPVEIVLKKAFYRAHDLRIRDLFDLAVVIDHAASAMQRNAPVLRSKADVLQARLQAMLTLYSSRATDEIAVLPAGEPYLTKAPQIVSGFLAALRSS